MYSLLVIALKQDELFLHMLSTTESLLKIGKLLPQVIQIDINL